jgi:hypothetical protein
MLLLDAAANALGSEAVALPWHHIISSMTF